MKQRRSEGTQPVGKAAGPCQGAADTALCVLGLGVQSESGALDWPEVLGDQGGSSLRFGFCSCQQSHSLGSHTRATSKRGRRVQRLGVGREIENDTREMLTKEK